jgi:hypothetical protein
MKRLLIGLSFIISLNSSAQDSSMKPETCTVQGTVVAIATGAPLKSAWVALRAVPPKDQPSEGVTEDGLFKEITDANGHFVIAGVPAGKYKFRAGKTGHVPGDYRLDGRARKATLVLHPGEKLDTVEFRLSRTAVIMGRVTDETGEPIAGVEMDAAPTGTRMGDVQLEDPLRIAVTSNLGEYRIHDLPPGSYYLSATDSGSCIFNTSWRLIWEVGERYANHLTMYYPDVTKSSEAQKVRLNAGEERRVDFTLPTVKLLTISGRVVGANGKPPAPNRVLLMLQDPISRPRADFRYGVTTDTQGNFEIREVLPGSYVFLGFVGEEEYWTEQRVEVAGDDVSGLVLQLRKDLGVLGKAKGTGGSKLDFQKLNIEMEFPTHDPSYSGAWDNLKEDGTFAIGGVRPTTQRISVHPMPEGWYLRSAFFGKQNVLDDGLNLSDSDSHEMLELTFSPTASRIQGVVLRGDDPAYDAVVRIFPEPANPNNTGLYREGPADEDGHFVIESVVPGRYRVVAYASERTDGDGGSPYDDSVSASVIVTEKESKTLELKLPKRDPN